MEAQEIPQIEHEARTPKKRELALVSRSTYLKEKALQWIFFACAFLAVVTVILIFVFTTYSALPVFTDIGLADFFSFTWAPSEGHYGIMSLLAGSGLVTVGALAMGVPLGVGTAVYLVEIASKRVRKLISPAVDLLAGIPSIIFGLVGMLLFVQRLGLKAGILAGGLTLVVMILPTIVRTTQESLKTVPQSYREGALGLGAGKWRMVRTVVLSNAIDGIVTGCILAVGRIVGESAALLYTAGFGLVLNGFFTALHSSSATLTVALYVYANERGETAVAFSIATILMVLTLLINLTAGIIGRKLKRK